MRFDVLEWRIQWEQASFGQRFRTGEEKEFDYDHFLDNWRRLTMSAELAFYGLIKLWTSICWKSQKIEYFVSWTIRIFISCQDMKTSLKLILHVFHDYDFSSQAPCILHFIATFILSIRRIVPKFLVSIWLVSFGLFQVCNLESGSENSLEFKLPNDK